MSRTLITDKEDVIREYKMVFEKMLNIATQKDSENNNIVTVEQLEFILSRGENGNLNAKER